MQRTSRAVALLVGLAAFAAFAVPALPAAVASSDPTVGPPVTQPDRLRVAADQFAVVDALANDTDPGDPSGTQLVPCRLPIGGALQLQEVSGYDGRPQLGVFPGGVAPGTYTVDYGVCDDAGVSPATLTVVVTHATQPAARVVRRGVVRFTDPAGHPLVIQYGGERAAQPDGRLQLAARSAVSVHTGRHVLVWLTTSHRGGTTSQSLSEVRYIQRRHPLPVFRRFVATPSPTGSGVAWRRPGAVRAVDGTWADGRRATTATAPPVTAPDRLTVAQDGAGVAQVLANDTDPADSSGAGLAVCRASVPPHSGLVAIPVSSGSFFVVFRSAATRSPSLPTNLFVAARRHARVGTYDVTYQACNDRYLTPGTVQVRVVPDRTVRAHRTGRPGVVRFVNPSRAPVHVVVRDAAQHGPATQAWYGTSVHPTPGPVVARFRLPAGTTHRLRVDTTAVSWSATGRHRATYGGVVLGIRPGASTR